MICFHLTKEQMGHWCWVWGWLELKCASAAQRCWMGLGNMQDIFHHLMSYVLDEGVTLFITHHRSGFIRFSPAKLTAPSHGGRPLDSNWPCRSTNKTSNSILKWISGHAKLSWINPRSYPCYLPWTRLSRYHCDLVAFAPEQTSQFSAHKARSPSCT